MEILQQHASTAQVVEEAEAFIRLFHRENPEAGDPIARIAAVRAEIAETGTYRHTPQELVHGARVAWRNSNRCIGRLYWNSLRVRDRRMLTEAEDVAGSASHTCGRPPTAAGSGPRSRSSPRTSRAVPAR